MKVGVISDSHDNLPKLREGVAIMCERQPELIIHAGDYIAPPTARCFDQVRERGIPFFGIFGNNDGERFGLRRLFEPIGPIHEDPYLCEYAGRRIVVTHREILVDALAKSGDFDVVIYGHTHQVDVRTDPCLIVNPGEAGGWSTGKHTLAIVDLTTLQAEIVEF